MLPENYTMAEVFRESGFAPRIRSAARRDRRRVPDDDLRRRRSSASRSATAPPPSRPSATSSSRASVAVIGASRERGTVGGEVFHNLLAAGFNGPVLPGQPAVPTSCSRCRPSSRSRDVAGEVELAVVAVPAAAGGRRGPGVRRKGRPGAGRDLRRLRRDRRGGAAAPAGAARGLPRQRHAPDRPELPRRPQHRATRSGSTRRFGPQYPPRGRRRLPVAERRARVSRSSTLRAKLGLGLSSFVSVGNKADISGNDLIQYWEADDAHGRDPALPRVVREPAQVRAGSPAGSARTQADRRRQERPLAGGRAGHVVAHRRAGGGLRRDRRRAVPAGRRRSAPTRSPSCSTSRRCSRTSRCRPAGASRSSPTPAGPGSCAPTPARRAGSRSPPLPRRRARRAGRVPARGGSRSRTPST